MTILLARGSGKFIAALIDGDPTAWTILVVVVAAMIAFHFIKKALSKA